MGETANFAVEIVGIGADFAPRGDRGEGPVGFDIGSDQIVDLGRQGVVQWAPGSLFAPLTRTRQGLQQLPEG